MVNDMWNSVRSHLTKTMWDVASLFSHSHKPGIWVSSSTSPSPPFSKVLCHQVLLQLHSNYIWNIFLFFHPQGHCHYTSIVIKPHQDPCKDFLTSLAISSLYSPTLQTAASMIFIKHRADHRTLLLKTFQWLPIVYRIKSRAFKAYISFHFHLLSFPILITLTLQIWKAE